ncbi:IclR family transcriptional regulator [Ruficoccus sp. ZRK36]|uniref:IclR family transcriptional regulator n=1 Tax=Ruficoccus sp. ZRK36 TaxID=2866311 RepID=UPI001C733B3B|nr:IclR family transcriptional regulator [Ruficoccus sp. ZRK36]QYY36878.1 IclR family transcriptional regulator [Ruficoccus sp. ZRK36]
MPRVNTLDKSLSIMEAVFQAPDGIGTRALAAKLDLNVATVHNIARTFCERGYLRQDPKTKLFHPGARIPLMGRHPSGLRPLTLAAGPFVREAADILNESVLLGAIDHGRIINLQYIPSKQALRAHEPEDVSDHSHCTAFGKVLLASLPENELEIYLHHTPLAAFTRNTLNSVDALRAELVNVRQQGYAKTRDEFCEGISAVAVPIHSPWGHVIASIGTSAPSLRMNKDGLFDKCLSTLKKAAQEIETVWGQSVNATPAS